MRDEVACSYKYVNNSALETAIDLYKKVDVSRIVT
jgi:hypothetical protein